MPSRPPTPRLSRASWSGALGARVGAAVAVPLFAAVVLACGTSAAGAKSPEQQSLAQYDLAREAFEAGRYRQALELLDKALAADEENADASYLAALVHLTFCNGDERSSDCRFPEAEKHARRALEVNAEHRDARNLLGVVLIHEKKYDEAIAVLKPLTEDILYASPEKSWGNLGWAYLERGQVDLAIDSLRRSVASQPLFCAGQYRLGLAYEKKGELLAAHEAFTRAVETDRPECQRLQAAFDARARIAEKQGHREEARADLERCRDIARTTPVGQRCAAQLDRRQ